jgi:hypothetical protein
MACGGISAECGVREAVTVVARDEEAEASMAWLVLTASGMACLPCLLLVLVTSTVQRACI